MLMAPMVLSALAVSSCSEPAKEEPQVPPVLSIKTQSVTGDAGGQFLSITASGSWTLSTSASWLKVEPTSGSGNTTTAVLSYTENTDAVRTGTVTLTSSGGISSASLTQNKKVVPAPPSDERGYGAKTASFKWLELPETKSDDGLEFFTHSMTIGSVQTRNYSFDWDYDNLVAPWVAYPLSSWNIGSGSRTDQWGVDPLLPESKQPIVYKPFSGFGSRGHQIPSADRQSKDANIQTFYGTNMTPQDYDFNGGTWAVLEGKVRDWARKTGATNGTDTLYVVTGCYVGNSTRKAYDNVGKAVAIPESYFKALLRYKNNSSVGHKGFMACAFWFDNENKYSSKISKDMSMSISDLEKKLGYKLFVNLEAKVGADTYKQIKDEDPSTVSWWWN